MFRRPGSFKASQIIGVSTAPADATNPDAPRGPIHGEDTCQGYHAAFCGGIGVSTRQARDAIDRSYVHDNAATLGHHDGDRVLATHSHAF
jgi:hypothetical protein